MVRPHSDNPETTAVDDVRRVRERIAREYGGDIHKHIDDTNRMTEEICAKLGVKLVRSTSRGKRRGVGAGR